MNELKSRDVKNLDLYLQMNNYLVNEKQTIKINLGNIIKISVPIDVV